MTLAREILERQLPELLQMENGSFVCNKEQWEERRMEIRTLLCEKCMGYSPDFPVQTEGRVGITEENEYGGKAVKQQIILSFQTPYSAFAFPFWLTVPVRHKEGEEKIPVFLSIGFTSELDNGEEIIDRGYAIAHINYQEIAPDREDEYANGLGRFCKRNPFNSWGKIGMWAYGAARVMDYLLTREELDHDKIAVIGHSRLGKTALWCGAMDERFSLVVSNDSGGGGAALFRGKSGERIEHLAGRGSGHWFCGNLFDYVGKEEQLPFDQHFLLSLVAPRHLYIASASLDAWADPHSELLGGLAASPAYELYGQKGLVCPDSRVEPDTNYHQGDIGYHMRTGTHYLSREDWQRVIAYRRQHQI